MLGTSVSSLNSKDVQDVQTDQTGLRWSLIVFVMHCRLSYISLSVWKVSYFILVIVMKFYEIVAFTAFVGFIIGYEASWWPNG